MRSLAASNTAAKAQPLLTVMRQLAAGNTCCAATCRRRCLQPCIDCSPALPAFSVATKLLSLSMDSHSFWFITVISIIAVAVAHCHWLFVWRVTYCWLHLLQSPATRWCRSLLSCNRFRNATATDAAKISHAATLLPLTRSSACVCCPFPPMIVIVILELLFLIYKCCKQHCCCCHCRWFFYGYSLLATPAAKAPPVRDAGARCWQQLL